MTAIPPSRYKVVERGRRLVVIDTLTGRPASNDATPRNLPARPTAPGNLRADQQSPTTNHPIQSTAPSRVDDASGAAIFTTSRFYDLKGPRRLVMNEAFSERFGKAMGGWMIALFVFAGVATLFFPWLWIAPVVILFQPKIRAAIRQWITARLDEADQPAS